jgi:hypothetical protein
VRKACPIHRVANPAEPAAIGLVFDRDTVLCYSRVQLCCVEICEIILSFVPTASLFALAVRNEPSERACANGATASATLLPSVISPIGLAHFKQEPSLVLSLAVQRDNRNEPQCSCCYTHVLAPTTSHRLNRCTTRNSELQCNLGHCSDSAIQRTSLTWYQYSQVPCLPSGHMLRCIQFIRARLMQGGSLSIDFSLAQSISLSPLLLSRLRWSTAINDVRGIYCPHTMYKQRQAVLCTCESLR